jgi:putative spermidine/putrescine transport system ATP-binding protein
MSAAVSLNQVVKRYGDATALHELNLEIQEGEFLSLLGPSGCGKTTTLRLIAGFIQPNEGTILLGNEDVTQVAPQHREIGMVFQDYALFPHMTVAENIGFGLKERNYPTIQINKRVGDLLDLIKLSDVGDRYPAEVSGGQQQRIAVARAVAYPPKVLLMDEPLGALDLKLRETMQVELRRIQQELKITTVYVTHDQTEAMSMSDRIVVMNTGRIEQIGGAEDIYNEPKTRFVADFVGQINLLDAEIIGVQGDSLQAKTLGIDIRVPRNNVSESGLVSIAVRPEHFEFVDPGTKNEGLNIISGRLSGRTFAGNLTRVYIDVGKEKAIVVESRPEDAPKEMGSQVNVGWKVSNTKVLLE